MERLIKERKPLRCGFTHLCTTIETDLVDEESANKYGIHLRNLIDKYERLQDVQAKILDLLLDASTEVEYEQEFEVAEQYRERYVELKTKLEGTSVERALSVNSIGTASGSRHVSKAASESSYESKATSENSHVSGAASTSSSRHSVRRRVKLPTLNLGNFSGEAMEWLGFWGKFKQIHEDDSIIPEDKFTYLSQSMTPGSKAKRFLDNYPTTAENYNLALQQLRERFARNDLLVEVYVRQLLNLVLENFMQGKVNIDIANLYDRLESYLQALETLGKTKTHFAEFFVPMVESCLPERLLRIWQRTKENTALANEDRIVILSKLMNFLRNKVQGEERIAMVKGGLAYKRKTEKVDKKEFIKKIKEPTVAALIVMNEKRDPSDSKDNCVFCKKGYASSECFNARKMTLEERKQAVAADNRCYNCLKGGHIINVELSSLA